MFRRSDLTVPTDLCLEILDFALACLQDRFGIPAAWEHTILLVGTAEEGRARRILADNQGRLARHVRLLEVKVNPNWTALRREGPAWAVLTEKEHAAFVLGQLDLEMG